VDVKSLLVVVVFAACAPAACAPAARAPSVPSVALTGDSGPIDARALVEGAPYTVITFFSAHCPTQAAHDARLVALYERYAARGVRFVAVDSERDASLARDDAERTRRGYPFSIVIDADASLARALGAENATYSVVADARGRVLYAGGIDSDRTHLTATATPYLADALDDLLAGRAPRVAEGKSLGCALQTKR